MKTEIQNKTVKFRVIVRDETNDSTVSFPIYDAGDYDKDKLIKKLEEYVKRL